jgi:hypothetical protein
MRIDCFSMMRKWHVKLYRYGLRMTFDLVIPEPGATFQDIYRQIMDIDAELAKPFAFTLKPEDPSNPNYYTKLATIYNTTLDARLPRSKPPFIAAAAPIKKRGRCSWFGNEHKETRDRLC